MTDSSWPNLLYEFIIRTGPGVENGVPVSGKLLTGVKIVADGPGVVTSGLSAKSVTR